MPKTVQLNDIARLPMPGDNVAIATHRLEAGAQISHNDETFTLDYTVLEGHRFAIQPIGRGQPLLSWQLPFGLATQDIKPGAYVCNAGMIEALQVRDLDFALPTQPNFEDQIKPYLLDEANFQPAPPVAPHDHGRTFRGYRRAGGRGVGTRNTIILLSANSRTGGYVRQLEARLKTAAAAYPHIDGIVAVAHTEGESSRPNNLDLLLRTLAGFMIHPNVGAVLAVDYGSAGVSNEVLRNYMIAHNYPLDQVAHRFLSLSEGFQASLDQGEAIVKSWFDQVNAISRTEEPASELKLALQCGGSDAFSGISGNPLIAWVAREIIRYGGLANLAETDELLGAEPYVLQKVKDLETARRFLATVERFKERAAWHGTSAEGNPSGGNKFRGLYNIVLKSIGAAMKRHPEVRLDDVIEYGQLMTEPGYYFMDSPGNDLESIAGQVAAGSNLIFFVTGNGSITNFPFVPTLKVVTTTKRYELLSRDMDVNAGAYLDGVSMDELGRDLVGLTLEVASGRQSVGEQAGHAQVQIWREWAQTDDSQLAHLLETSPPDGAPIPIDTVEVKPPEVIQFKAIRTSLGYTTNQVGLILPTSLCSSQIARMTTDYLNQIELGRAQGLSHFVSLTHTEGCGVSSGPSEALYTRTLLGYLAHPLVKHCLLLEHGCEKTHNDYMRHHIQQIGLDPQQFGWASVQLDGGIEAVRQKIEAWFTQQLAETEPPVYELVGLEGLRLGLTSAGPLSAEMAEHMAHLTQVIVGAGGTVVTPENGDLLQAPAYRVTLLSDTLRSDLSQPSLAYGQRIEKTGFYIMESPSQHWVETLTGLGATGAEMIVAYVGDFPRQSHPLVPVVQVMTDSANSARYRPDVDLILSADPAIWLNQTLQGITEVINQKRAPKLYQQGNIDFQVTRGLLGVSL